jgi:type VI secretion system protein ImpE
LLPAGGAMTARELLDAGKLSPAIEQLGQEVKAHPADVRGRTFLFELLCFAGDYDRAERQLDVIGHQSESAEIGVDVYRKVITAERARARLFLEGGMPAFMMEPPTYAALHLEAIDQLRSNRPGEARTLLEQAERSRPRVKGKLGDQAFSDLRDSDDRIGPFLEVILGDQYTWVPFEQIERLEITKPKMLRDLLWNLARLECRNGPRGEVVLPVLYPGSNQHADDRVRLGRLTEWVDAGDGFPIGVGQRLFVVDGEDHAMLEMQTLEFQEA